MAMIDQYFERIRATFQQAPSVAGWKHICDHVGYGVASDGPDASAQERERFITSYMPHIKAAAARWPAALRIVTMHDPDEVQALGKTMRLSLRYEKINKAKLATWRAQLNSEACAGIDGVIVEALASHAQQVLDALDRDGARPLRRVALELEPVRGGTQRMALLEGDVASLLALMLARHHGHLEALELRWRSPDWRDDVTSAVVWPLLMSWADRLSALRSLALSVTHETTPQCAALLAHPALSQLDTVFLHSARYEGLDADFLLEREANAHLRRVGITHISEEHARRLVLSPKLGEVHSWELHHDSGWRVGSYDWGTERAMYWRGVQAAARAQADSDAAEAAPAVPPLLMQRRVDLSEMNARETAQVLFDAGGALHPSELIEELTLACLAPELLERFFEGAHEAYPQLRRLELTYSSYTQRIWLKASDYAMLAASPLLPQLSTLRWYSKMFDHGMGWPDRAPQWEARIDDWLALCFDEALPLVLRRRAWASLWMDARQRMSELKDLAKRLGLKGYSKLKQRELEAAIVAKLPPALTREFD